MVIVAAALLTLVVFNLLLKDVDVALMRIVLFPGLIIGALTLLAGMVSPHHNAKKPWKEAVAVSVAKMQMLAGQILFPTFLYYADLASDIYMIRRFWHEGHDAFAIINSLALVAGLALSVNGNMLSRLLVLFHINPLLVTVQAMFLFCGARSATGNDPRYRSLHGYFQSEGCAMQLVRSSVSEAFAQAFVSTFVQTYAMLTQSLSWNFLSTISLLLSLVSIVRPFSFLDMYQYVSREIHGQPILVGIAQPESLTFALVVAYRLVEVSSQVLFFTLFQVGFDDLKFHGLRYGGILLWSLDCALQALLVVAYTGNLKKLVFAIPNTIGAYEPVLLRGSAGQAFLSTPALLQVLIHLCELILALTCVFTFKSADAYDLLESHVWMKWVLWYFASCNVVRYSLFFFLYWFCAYDVDAEWRTNADRVYVTKLLTDKALEEADNSDKIIPLEIAGIAEFSGKGGLDPEKAYDAMVHGRIKLPYYVAGHICQIVARAAHKIDIKDKGNMEMACEAVLKAMQQHPTESTVQRAASRALFNLVSGCGDNKLFFAKRQALSLLLKSVLEHDGDDDLRRYVFMALQEFAGDETGHHLDDEKEEMGPNVLESVLANLRSHRKVIFYYPKMRKQFYEEGALEELLHSMREYREDSDVQRTACLALRRFAMDDRSGEVLERMRCLGVQDDVRRAMDMHAGALQYEARKLMDALEVKVMLPPIGVQTDVLSYRVP